MQFPKQVGTQNSVIGSLSSGSMGNHAIQRFRTVDPQRIKAVNDDLSRCSVPAFGAKIKP